MDNDNTTTSDLQDRLKTKLKELGAVPSDSSEPQGSFETEEAYFHLPTTRVGMIAMLEVINLAENPKPYRFAFLTTPYGNEQIELVAKQLRRQCPEEFNVNVVNAFLHNCKEKGITNHDMERMIYFATKDVIMLGAMPDEEEDRPAIIRVRDIPTTGYTGCCTAGMNELPNTCH